MENAIRKKNYPLTPKGMMIAGCIYKDLIGDGITARKAKPLVEAGQELVKRKRVKVKSRKTEELKAVEAVEAVAETENTNYKTYLEARDGLIGLVRGHEGVINIQVINNLFEIKAQKVGKKILAELETKQMELKAYNEYEDTVRYLIQCGYFIKGNNFNINTEMYLKALTFMCIMDINKEEMLDRLGKSSKARELQPVKTLEEALFNLNDIYNYRRSGSTCKDRHDFVRDYKELYG